MVSSMSIAAQKLCGVEESEKNVEKEWKQKKTKKKAHRRYEKSVKILKLLGIEHGPTMPAYQRSQEIRFEFWGSKVGFRKTQY